MNHERSLKCIHNIYSTVVKPVCSCRIMQSGELYKYLQILLTSWRQSSGGPLGCLEGGSTWCARGSWRNQVCQVCFPFTCRSFYGQAIFFWEVHEMARGNGHKLQQKMTRLSIKKNFFLCEWGKFCRTGHRISIFGDIWSRTGQGPQQPDLTLQMALLWLWGWTGWPQSSLLT